MPRLPKVLETPSLSFAVLVSRLIVLSLFTFGTAAKAQSGPGPGISPLSTQAGGPYDSIDLATGSINILVPVRTQIGQLPFAFTISGSSGVVYPASAWTSFTSFTGTSSLPKVTYQRQSQQSSCPQFFTYTNFAVTDSTGTTHSVPGAYAIYEGTCGSYVYSGTAIDGSGYTINITSVGYNSVAYTLHDTSGNILSSSSPAMLTDPDGSSISSSTANGVTAYTDTLGTTAMNVSGSPYSYTDASGNPQTFQLNYSSYTMQTAFGCSGVTELGPSKGSLPSSITTPIGSFTLSYETPPGYSGNGAHGPYTTGRITKLTYPTGGSVSYTYSGGNNGINCVSEVVPTLVRSVYDSQSGSTSTWTYVNSNTTALLSPGNFTVVETDPANNQAVYKFSGEYQTDKTSFQGGCTGFTGCNGGGSQLVDVLTCYNANLSNCAAPSSVPTLPINQTDVYTTLGGMSQSNRVTQISDTYGNVTKTVMYGFGAGTPTRTIDTPVGSYQAGVGCNVIGNYINNRLCYKNVYSGSDSGGTLLSSETYSYDAKGHLQSHVVGTTTSGISGPTLTTAYTYNSIGVPVTKQDVNGTITNINYNGTGGCAGILPTSTVVSGMTVSYQWDCNGGVVTKVIDANGQSTQYAHNDPLWRLTQTTDPLGNTTTNTYALTSIESVLAFVNPAQSTSTVDKVTTLDSLGRPTISQIRQSPGSSNFDTVSSGYDLNGRVASVSMPCVQTVGLRCPASPATTTTYDGVGRPLQVTDSGGGYSSYSYNNQDVLITVGPAPSGENLKKRQMEYDGIGRLTSVCEITSASGSGPCAQASSATGYFTAYTYDSPVNSLAVTQNATQTRVYKYDSIGRLVSEQNPESGTKSYVYDTDSTMCGSGAYTSNGDLVKTTDAANNCVMYYHDGLHRLTDVGNSSQSTSPCKRFRYDNSTGVSGSIPSGVTVQYPMGRLAESETDNCSGSTTTDEWFSYDQDGRETDMYESTLHSGGYYHTTAGYAANGVLQSLSGIPGYAGMSYGLDGEGRLSTALHGTQKIVCDSSCSQSSTQYNAASQPTTINIGGFSDNDAYSYDVTGRMKTYSFTVGSTPTSISGTPTWNPNGSLQSLAITDGFNSGGTQNCSYGADDLSRLASVNCVNGSTNVWGQNFTYDPFGNITKTVPTGTTGIAWMPGYNESTNQYTLTGTSYDGNGNLLDDTFHDYAWD